MIAEIRCNQLTEEQLRTEIVFFAKLFLIHSKSSVTAMYGWDCDLEIDDLYQDIQIGGDEITEFVRRSEDDGIFRLGKSDLFFRSGDAEFEFVLCHESDIHFTAPEVVVSTVRKHWDETDIGSYAVELKKT